MEGYVSGMKNLCYRSQFENGLLGGILGSLVLLPFLPIFGEKRLMATSSSLELKHLVFPLVSGLGIGGFMATLCKHRETEYERDFIEVCSGIGTSKEE
jgi:hypothetical protein